MRNFLVLVLLAALGAALLIKLVPWLLGLVEILALGAIFALALWLIAKGGGGR